MTKIIVAEPDREKNVKLNDRQQNLDRQLVGYIYCTK